MGNPKVNDAHCSLRQEGGQPLHPGVRPEHPGPRALPGVRGHLLPRQRRCLVRRLAPRPPPGTTSTIVTKALALVVMPSSPELGVAGAGVNKTRLYSLLIRGEVAPLER